MNDSKKAFKKYFEIFLAFFIFRFIIIVAFFRGLEEAPTFLVPIINPPFADNSPHSSRGQPRFSFDRIAFSLGIDDFALKYEWIYRQLEELFQKIKNKISRMATMAALLHHKMLHYFWTGFYVLENGELIVGP